MAFTILLGSIYSITEDDYFKDHYIQSSVVNGTGTAIEQQINVIVTNTYVGTVWTSGRITTNQRYAKLLDLGFCS